MLTTHFNAVEAQLLATSKIPGTAGHPIHKGTPRESFIRDFLERHLNAAVAIGTGEIIDHQSRPGERRNQFDIIIYKKNYPKIDFGGGINAFLAESVVATIEVKSTLDKQGIVQAVGAAHAAKQLQLSEDTAFWHGYVPKNILSFVVAYDGPASMGTVHNWVKEAYVARGIYEPEMPEGVNRSHIAGPALEGVFVLGKGFNLFDNAPYNFIQPEVRKQAPEIRWVIVDTEAGSLLAFFLLLTVATSSNKGSVLNPLPYLSNFRIFNTQYAR